MKLFKTNLWTRFLVVLLGVLGFACGDSDDEDINNPDDPYFGNTGGGDWRGDLCLYGSPYGSYKLVGKVMDQDSVPIAGANVRVKWGDSAISDSDGNYTINDDDSDYHQITIVTECEGYEKDSVELDLHFTGGNRLDWYQGHCDTTYNPILKKIVVPDNTEENNPEGENGENSAEPSETNDNNE